MFKLALNAGHGLKTAGKRCMKKLDPKETREWTLNSRICEKIEKKLEAYSGCDILRLDDVTGQKDIALKKRTDSANYFMADFYLSIHHNAGVKGGTGGGIATYVYTKASPEEKDWQNDLYKALIKHTGLKGNRADGTCKANLHECRESKMPCVLIEAGFMDSKTDVPIILSDKFADQVADACVEVIVKLGKLKKKAQPKPKADTKKEEPKKEETKKETKKNTKILNWQKAAIKDGFKFTSGADGIWGKECEAVAKKAICKKQLIGYKYKNLTKIIQETVDVKADGKFGTGTKNAVIKYQKKNKLTADGCVGLNTWKKILGV